MWSSRLSRAALPAMVAGVLAAISVGSIAAPIELSPAPDGVDATEVARLAEGNLRSDRTFFSGRMTVTSPRLMRPRVIEFDSWEDRPGKRSFVRIRKPARDAGTTFLKHHPNLWMFIPRVERTVRVPPSMMSQSWMGSDFSNDDLVRESSEIDDYEHRLLGLDLSEGTPGSGAYVVEYEPHENVAVVWGKIVAWIDVVSGVALRQEFYDEDGEKLRLIRFEDVREVEGRKVPHRWTLTPLGKEGHETLVEVLEISFDPKFESSLFTRRNLESGARGR